MRSVARAVASICSRVAPCCTRCGARIVVVTHEATDAALSDTVAALADLEVVLEVASVLRLEGTSE
mgnify:CR=1 FL=1